jgi:hypothetical protein
MRCSLPLTTAEEDKQAEQEIMRLLLEDRGLFTLGEIVHETGRKVLPVTDAITRLQRAGMVHEVSTCVFASRAAVVGAELWGVG